MLRRSLYGLALVGRRLRPFAGFLIVVVALLSVIGYLASMLWFPATSAERDTRVSLLVPSSAVENYIKGQQNYNAELMWASLSPDSQADQLRGGSSKQTMQSQMDLKKNRGLRFNRYEYVGGVKLDEGGSMYFYSVELQVQDQRGKLPMTFLVDKDGKVSDIISPPILTDLASSNSQ